MAQVTKGWRSHKQLFFYFDYFHVGYKKNNVKLYYQFIYFSISIIFLDLTLFFYVDENH
jgi:hypothetical protein